MCYDGEVCVMMGKCAFRWESVWYEGDGVCSEGVGVCYEGRVFAMRGACVL